ncbi:MAG: membrane dipeptidase, partial [Proteobacteria bacterium]|nr:membrane dipeptidase [Pseudomonadota bacterium]
SHVGIGLDYAFESEGGDEGLGSVLESAPDYWPKAQYDYPSVDCAHPRQILELTEELLRRQYKEDDVVAILGGNFMRVAEAVWK